MTLLPVVGKAPGEEHDDPSQPSLPRGQGSDFITCVLPQKQILFLNLSRPGCSGTANTARAGRVAAPRVWCWWVEARHWMEGNPPVRGPGAAAKGLSLLASTSLFTGKILSCFPVPFPSPAFSQTCCPSSGCGSRRPLGARCPWSGSWPALGETALPVGARGVSQACSDG